jgi:hypothetical protein
VCYHEDVTGLWNLEVNTDKAVTAKRPDIITKNEKDKTSTLIDVAMSTDRYVT